LLNRSIDRREAGTRPRRAVIVNDEGAQSPERSHDLCRGAARFGSNHGKISLAHARRHLLA
jgi:hypothetical protein